MPCTPMRPRRWSRRLRPRAHGLSRWRRMSPTRPRSRRLSLAPKQTWVHRKLFATIWPITRQCWKDAQAMPPRGPEAAIAKFLRDALARDDVGVPTLEVMARRAGLLGEHQRYTREAIQSCEENSWHKVASGRFWCS